MVRKESVAHITRQAAEQGLARLMMRLPATRGTIRAAAASQPHFYELCGAYGEACAVLDRMRPILQSSPNTRSSARKSKPTSSGSCSAINESLASAGADRHRDDSTPY